MTDAGTCRSCSGACRQVLDLGELPILNRYPSAPGEVGHAYRFVLAVCTVCGLLQQEQPPSVEDVLVGAGTYREPTQHLADVARAIGELVGLPAPGTIRGISEHDVPLVAALRGGDAATAMLSVERLLDGAETPPPTALLQDRLTADGARLLVEIDGTTELLVARSLIEHAHDLPGLLAALKTLVTDGGHLVIEVPDAGRLLATADPSLLWEEHVFYFTEHALRETLSRHGFEPLSTTTIDEVGELVCVARRSDSAVPADGGTVQKELEAADRLTERVTDLGARWRAFLAAHRAAGRRCALFGAGHTGAMFVNALGLGAALDVVIDDAPAKQGRLLSGSDLPVVPSTALADGIGLCVLSVSGELEGRIVAANDAFIAAGGVFASIAPTSPRYALADPVRIEPRPILSIEDDDVDEMVELARRTTRGRARICAHGDPADALHEMLIVLDRSTYIRPHRHLGRPESFHVVAGEADIVLFDDDGSVTAVLAMGPYGSGRTFYYRMNEPTFHMVLVRSEQFVVHETTTGPFDPAGTEQAPWAPLEDDLEARAAYLTAITSQLDRT